MSLILINILLRRSEKVAIYLLDKTNQAWVDVSQLVIPEKPNKKTLYELIELGERIEYNQHILQNISQREMVYKFWRSFDSFFPENFPYERKTPLE